MKVLAFIIWQIIFILSSCDNPTSHKSETLKTKNLISIGLNREELTTFSSLKPKEILNRLFDNPDFDSLGMAIWKGNYSDLTSLSIPLSYDSKFHTSLDTILFFTDTKKRNCAIAIFSTYNFQPDAFDSSKIRPTGCHACGVPIGAALFSLIDTKTWELYDFKKQITQLGWFGEYKTGRRDAGKIQVKEIGDKWSCLSLTEGLGGNGGYLEGSEDLFSVEEYKLDGSPNPTLKNILSNDYVIKESFLTKKIFPEIEPVKQKGCYYDLLVRTINDETIKTKTYKYSPDCEKYVCQ